MTEELDGTTVSELSVSDRLDELVDRLQGGLAGPDGALSLVPIRRAIEALLVETAAERLDPFYLALRRVGFLTELWECLSSEHAASAQDIGFFCIKAISQL